jgi:capsular polysaccharide transport system permease protein
MIDETAAGADLSETNRQAGQRRRARRHRALRAVPDTSPEAQPPEQDNIVQFVRRLQEEVQEQPQRKIGWPAISAIACILVPTFLAAVYYLLIATDQYVSEARFSVRSNEAQVADALGMLTGMPRATVVSDSYIVADYIESREMVAELEQRLPLREIYSGPRADFLMRLDPKTTEEGMVSYWEDVVSVLFDTTKSTIELQVRAFDPAHAQRITSEIVNVVRTLVNEISAQSRRDAVQFAAAEVARSELRVRGARQDMLAFRTEHNEFDPAQTASATLGRVAQLETERSQLKSQLSSIDGYLSDEAPSVQMLQSKISAVEEEIARVENEISTSSSDSSSGSAPGASNALAGVLAEYQELVINQQFAENAYTAALASLERARTEADRTQSYLAVYLQPSVPDEATYPRRILNIFIVFVLCCILWAVGSLGYLTVRDHMA